MEIVVIGEVVMKDGVRVSIDVRMETQHPAEVAKAFKEIKKELQEK